MDTLSVFRSANNKTDVTNAKLDVDEKTNELSDVMKKFYDAIIGFNEGIGKVKEAREQLVGNNNAGWDEVKKNLEEANAMLVKYYDAVDLSKMKLVYLKEITNAENEKEYIVEKKTKKDNPNTAVDANVLSSAVKEFEGATNSYKSSMSYYLTEDASGTTIEENYKKFRDEYMPKVIDMTNYYYGVVKLLKDGESSVSEIDAQIEENNKLIENDRAVIEENNSNMTIPEVLAASKEVSKLEKENEALEKQKTDADSLKKDIKAYEKDIRDLLEDSYQNVSEEFRKFEESYQKNVENANKEVGKRLSFVYHKLRPYYDAINEVTTDKSGGFLIFNKKTHQEKIKSLAEDVKEKIDEVNASASELAKEATSYANKESKDEYYQSMKSTAESTRGKYKKEDVDEITDQVCDILNYFGGKDGTKHKGVVSLLEGQLYKGDFIKQKEAKYEESEKGYKKTGKEYFKRIKKLIKSDQTKDQKLIDKCYKDYVLVMQEDEPFYTGYYLKKISDANVPINDGKDTVNIPKFYLYLVSAYGGEKKDDDKENGEALKDAGEKINEDAEETATGEKEAEEEAYQYSSDVLESLSSVDGGLDLNKYGEYDANSNTGILQQFKNTTNAAKGILGILSNPLENSRDNLLVTEYLFENFSYATLSKEAKKEETVPKTLTNIDISKENNAIYGCEIEYILYGYKGSGEGDGPEGNVKNVKNNIFAIRFLMNSIFALTDSKINTETLPPALAIQTATAGFFPAKVAQVVIKLCLSLAESVYDLNQLMDGEKVPLVKTSTTFFFTPEGLLNKMKNGAVDKVAEMTKEKMNEEFGKLENYLQDAVSKGLDDVEDSINATVKGISDDLASSMQGKLDDAMSALVQVSVDVVENQYIKVLTSDTTIYAGEVKAELRNSLISYIDDADFGQQVKDFLKSYVDDLVEKVLDTKITNVNDQELNGNTILQVLEKYSSEISTSITEEITVTNQRYNEFVEAIYNNASIFISDNKKKFQDKVVEWTSDTKDKIASKVNAGISAGVNGTKKFADDTVDQIAEEVNSTLDKHFPNKEVKVDAKTGLKNSTIGNVFSFSYKNYLELFIFLEISRNDTSVLRRIGDVIELNVKKGLTSYYAKSNTPSAHPAGEKFSMSNAYTYLDISANIKVKPLLLSRRLFTKSVSKNQVVSFWGYEYQTSAGY